MLVVVHQKKLKMNQNFHKTLLLQNKELENFLAAIDAHDDVQVVYAGLAG